MKNKKLIWIGGVLTAVLLVGAMGWTAAFAQGPTGTPLHGRGPGSHPLGGPELDAAAKALGITTDALKSELQAGKTLEQVAEAKGVDIDKVRDAIKAAHETELRDRIKQAVVDGKMSQAKADWLLEGLDKGFLDGPGGFGFGPGPKGPGGGQGQPLFGPPSQQGGGN